MCMNTQTKIATSTQLNQQWQIIISSQPLTEPVTMCHDQVPGGTVVAIRNHQRHTTLGKVKKGTGMSVRRVITYI